MDMMNLMIPGAVAAVQIQAIIPPPVLGMKCADMLCLVFRKHGALHYDQTSGLCSISIEICSDAALRT